MNEKPPELNRTKREGEEPDGTSQTGVSAGWTLAMQFAGMIAIGVLLIWFNIPNLGFMAIGLAFAHIIQKLRG